MIHTTEEIQAAFKCHTDDPYFYYKEIQPVQIWYNDSDRSFHTSVGISMDFEKFELLTEAEQIQVCAQWSDDDWFKYFVSKGTITLDEFCEKLKIAAYKIAN